MDTPSLMKLCANCEHHSRLIDGTDCEPCVDNDARPNFEQKIVIVRPSPYLKKTSDPYELPEQPVAKKFDGDKPPMALLDPEWLEGVARVLGFGAQKYAADNWRQGLEIRRLLSAGMRHMNSFNRGEDIDPESGECHLYHASCCLMFASWMMNHKPELDDRYKQ